jgi:hypothetical protein
MKVPLVLSELYHLITATVIFILFFGSIPVVHLLFLVFVSSFLVDVDHLLDYGLFLFRTKNPISLKYFLTGMYFKKSKQFFIMFHSWEIPILLSILYLVTTDVIYLIVSYCLIGHYFVDIFTNKVRLESYSLLYRWHTGFTDICS